MGSLAQLAKAKGYQVSGVDHAIYPPMSTQLANAGIDVQEGYDPSFLAQTDADMFVIGNVVARGNPMMEAILDKGLPYVSGPQWLAEQVLQNRWVLGVSGTHGKTTTVSMLTWLLSDNGFEPGYLIGGVPENFECSASLGKSDFFVIEADEYDSAFFDKRSKFLHYRPRTLVINNLEFDHADIFADLDAIQTQFHHLVRTVPSEGLLILPDGNQAIDEVVDAGCWTPIQRLGAAWRADLVSEDGGEFEVFFEGESCGVVTWGLSGQHNVDNALAALAAARHVGLRPKEGVQSLARFQGVKRRMETVLDKDGVLIFDDFAHHPTAIQTTLEGARKKFPDQQLWAIIEPRSNTMKQGVHKSSLKPACDAADQVFWFEDTHPLWSINDCPHESDTQHRCFNDVDQIVADVAQAAKPNTVVIIMSNGGFGGIHQKLCAAFP